MTSDVKLHEPMLLTLPLLQPTKPTCMYRLFYAQYTNLLYTQLLNNLVNLVISLSGGFFSSNIPTTLS